MYYFVNNKKPTNLIFRWEEGVCVRMASSWPSALNDGVLDA